MPIDGDLRSKAFFVGGGSRTKRRADIVVQKHPEALAIKACLGAAQ